MQLYFYVQFVRQFTLSIFQRLFDHFAFNTARSIWPQFLYPPNFTFSILCSEVFIYNTNITDEKSKSNSTSNIVLFYYKYILT